MQNLRSLTFGLMAATAIVVLAGCATGAAGNAPVSGVGLIPTNATLAVAQASHLHTGPNTVKPTICTGCGGDPPPCSMAPSSGVQGYGQNDGDMPYQGNVVLYVGATYTVDGTNYLPCDPDAVIPLGVSSGPNTSYSSATSPWNKKCNKSCYAFADPADGYVAIVNETKKGQSILTKLQDYGQTPVAVSADGASTLYVSSTAIDQSYDYSGIAVYSMGKPSAKRFLYARDNTSGPVTTGGVAVDSHHNVFLSGSQYGQGFVEEFQKGNNPGVDLGITTTGPGGILIDKHGNLVVADPGLPGVEVFAPGSHTPSAILATSGSPTSISFDRRQTHIWVTDPKNATMSSYSYPGGTLEATAKFGTPSEPGVPFSFQPA